MLLNCHLLENNKYIETLEKNGIGKPLGVWFRNGVDDFISFPVFILAINSFLIDLRFQLHLCTFVCVCKS